MLNFRMALVASLLCCSGWTRGEAPRPLGAWFSNYDKLTFDNEISWGSDYYLVSYYSSPFHVLFRIADLPRYCAVFFGQATAPALKPEEQKEVEKWVSGGGSLVLGGDAGLRLFGDRPPEWLSIKEWRATDKPEIAMIQKPEHPLARGLNRYRVPEAPWRMTTVAVTRAGAVPVLGRGDLALVAVVEHGKGKVVFLGGALTPAGRPAYLEKTLVRDLPPLSSQMWQNLLEFLVVPRRSQLIGDWASHAEAIFPRDAPAVLWWRHQKETPLGAKLYSPPHPIPDDIAAAMNRAVDLGRGDRHRFAFFLTSLREQTLTAKVQDLRHGDDRFPAGQIQLFVQEQPLPGYPFGSYWLVPLGSPLPLKANHTYSFWLTLDSGSVPPGAYAGAVHFLFNPGDTTMSLPLRVKIRDVSPVDPDLLHFELEHCWFTMPGGYRIEKDTKHKIGLSLEGKKLIDIPLNDPGHLGSYIRALGELEVNFGQSWGDVDRLYTLDSLRLREGGQLLTEEIDHHPGRFRQGDLPHLDFATLFDTVFDQAIAAGMRHFAMNYSRETDGTLALTRRIASDPSLSADSEFHKRIRTWYWREYARYLHERGLLGVYTKIFDEFGPAEIPGFIGSARAIRPAGFKTYSTTYNFNHDPAAVKQIAPYIDMWQLGWDRKPNERFAPLGIHSELWGTTASSYWGNSLDFGRAAGWAAARLGYQGVHTHGYMRWHWNDHEGCLPGPDGPFQTVAVISYAQGITEGRRLGQLYRLIELARGRKDTAALAGKIEKDLHTTVVGFDPACLVELRDQPAIPGGGFPEYWYPDVCLSPAVYDQARARVLRMSEQLTQALKPLPTLHYGSFIVVRDGRPHVDLIANTSAADPLISAVRAKTGVLLHPQHKEESQTPAIIMGTPKDVAVRRFVGGELRGKITSTYPHVGGYFIQLLPATADHADRLLIVGGDAAGLNKGARQMARLLTVRDG